MGLFRPLLAREGNVKSFQLSSVGSQVPEFFFFKSSSNINVEKVTFLYNRPHEHLVPEPLISCVGCRKNDC